MVNVIIFDFFGVISKSDPYETWLIKHGFTRTGDFLDISRNADLGKISLDGFYESLASLSNIDKKYIVEELEYIEINTDVVALIKRLNKEDKYKIGLISNAPSELLRPILVNNSLESYFDEIIISSEVGYIKPEPEIFDLMLRKLEAHPTATVIIDDLERYVDAAKELGINAILFKNTEDLLVNLKSIGVAA